MRPFNETGFCNTEKKNLIKQFVGSQSHHYKTHLYNKSLFIDVLLHSSCSLLSPWPELRIFGHYHSSSNWRETLLSWSPQHVPPCLRPVSAEWIRQPKGIWYRFCAMKIKEDSFQMSSLNYFWKEFFCGIIKVTFAKISSRFSIQHVNSRPLMSSYWKPSHPSPLQYYHKCCNNSISLFT